MADIIKIKQLVENNLYIINNMNHISKEHIRVTINNIVKYNMYKCKAIMNTY